MEEFKTIYISKSKVLAHQYILRDISIKKQLDQYGKFLADFQIEKEKTKQHVVLVGGGMSAERDVSFMSSNGVANALVELGHYVTFVDMGADFAEVVIRLQPDVVFNILHGTYGEDGCLPGLLNILRIPYTHSGVLASSVSFNKKKSLEIFTANNILVPEGIIVKKSDNIKTDPMVRPYVVKPISQGSSIGVILVFPEDKFNFADYDYPYGDEIIVEEYVKNTELQIAVLNGKALGVLELQFLQDKRFYDYETKYTDGFAKHILPANIPDAAYKEAMNIAERAYNIMGCSGLVRVEILYDRERSRYYLLEINTHPGMTPLSICPEIAAYNGISYTRLVHEILDKASFE